MFRFQVFTPEEAQGLGCGLGRHRTRMIVPDHTSVSVVRRGFRKQSME
jgi:hypothetical protein